MTHEQFIHLLAFVASEKPKKVDAALFIEGDGLSRPEVAVKLYKEKFVPHIVVTGEVLRDPGKNSRTARVVEKLQELGVPKNKISIEASSINTREQAVETMKLAKQNGWKSIILIVPLYHQPRAYATFLKAMKEAKINLHIINHPVTGLTWFQKTNHGGKTRKDLLKIELAKIKNYTAKGHVATFAEILRYTRRKEAGLSQEV